MISFDKLFSFVLLMTKKYNIDSSHSEGHSLDVLHYSHILYEKDVINNPHLSSQLNVIYSAAVLHDMCDRKYIKPEEGMEEIQQFLKPKMQPDELYYTKRIIETMSYSKVKVHGFPNLGMYQEAYHIVRQADLLSSYDFDRSIVYHMNRGNSLTDSYENAVQLFDVRVFKYKTDNMLTSEYARQLSIPLTNTAVKRINVWKNILYS